MSNNNKKILKDVLILGQAAPVEIKGGRKSICTAGWSPHEGMIRLYPVPTTTKARMWSQIEVPVVKNNQDVRYESWKIEGSKSEWDVLSKKVKDVGKITSKPQKLKLLSQIMKKHSYDCVNDLNDKKGSLGIIEPEILETTFEDRKKFQETVQLTLDSEVRFLTSENFKKIPVIKYRCPNCKTKNRFHKQQLLAWEAYEWMRNNKGSVEQLWENLHLNDSEWQKYFLVGNQAYHLKSFMIISVIRFKKP